MKTRNGLLNEITKCDAMQAQWGSKSCKLCEEYAERYSEFKKGDKVKIYNSWGDEKFGKVENVFFDTTHYFKYHVKIWKKDFSNPKKREYPILVSKNRDYNIIKKATE